MTGTMRQIQLVSYPEDKPGPENFRMVEHAPPEPGDGEILVEVLVLSMDPFPRLRMRADSTAGPPLPLGRVMDGRGIGRVIKSRHPGIRTGDHVYGDLGWQTHAVLAAAQAKPVDLSWATAEQQLGILGPSGLTAFFALHEEGRPKPGETVVIAPAAGSVGTIAGQIARLKGCRVVGIAGGGTQCDFLVNELGFDAAVDYQDGPRFAAALAAACPDGVDLFLDGVGGPTHDAVAERINLHGRIVLIGFISGYNDDAPARYGQPLTLLFRRAAMKGFLLADYEDRFDEARRILSGWLRDGRIRPVETVWHGLDQAPAAFAALFAAPRPGKQLVRVSQ